MSNANASVSLSLTNEFLLIVLRHVKHLFAGEDKQKLEAQLSIFIYSQQAQRYQTQNSLNESIIAVNYVLFCWCCLSACIHWHYDDGRYFSFFLSVINNSCTNYRYGIFRLSIRKSCSGGIEISLSLSTFSSDHIICHQGNILQLLHSPHISHSSSTHFLVIINCPVAAS